MITEKKEKGNEAFKLGNYKEALGIYTDIISGLQHQQDSKPENNEYFICLNNRSLCYLKLGNYENALNDTNELLKSDPGNLKALYRRSQAYKGLQRYEESIKDAKMLISMDSKNQEFILHMKSLVSVVENKVSEQSSLNSKAQLMLDIVEKKAEGNVLNALNNMIVLAKEQSGAVELMKIGTIFALKPLLDSSSDSEILLATIRILATLSKSSNNRSTYIMRELTFNKIIRLICTENESVSTAVTSLIQNIILAITDLETKRKSKKPNNEYFEFPADVENSINEIFRSLILLLTDPSCSGHGRDNVIDLCLKNFDNASGCAWTSRFIILGVPKLLTVASYLPEYENKLKVTENTKLHAACCLSAIYDDISSDKEREEYISVCDEFIRELSTTEDEISKVKAVSCLSILLQGPFEVGNALVGKNNMIQVMLEMANSDEPIRQKVAVEAIVYSASKKDKATGILADGLDILKKLYLSSNQDLKVRALTGLCKLSSSKGSDASVKILADGSNYKLEKACRKFICNASTDYETKKWAADGLAYLTLDADVKEEIINDLATVKALYELIKKGDKNTLYSIATIFVNLANAFEVKKPSEELLELAKYAKYHIPEEHEKDKEKCVEERRQKLMDSGIAQVLVSMSKYDNKNCNELISQIFAALCKDANNRGPIVAAGGGKVLIPMALKGTEKGRTRASQALAAITISINPEISFPGQRCVEVVRPLINLLQPERTPLENFEALMALTNLAQVNEATRKSMLKDSGFSCIEQYMFDEDPMLRKAATECICNLVQEEEVVNLFMKENNDRVKLLVLYCGEEDIALNIAASGSLAQLSLENETICKKIIEVNSFIGIFKESACTSDIQFQFRIFYILNNITSINKELCLSIVESELMDVIIAVTRLEVEDERMKVKNLANEIVKRSLEYNLIKPAGDLSLKNDVIEEES